MSAASPMKRPKGNISLVMKTADSATSPVNPCATTRTSSGAAATPTSTTMTSATVRLTSVLDASFQARAVSPRACNPLKRGMKADSTVVSARILHSRLGMVKATTKMSIDVPAPKKAAVTTSLAKPDTLEIRVPVPMCAKPRTMSPPLELRFPSGKLHIPQVWNSRRERSPAVG